MVYILLKHQLIVISLNSFMLRKLNMILVRIHTSYVHNKHMFENLCISRILPLSTILIFDLGIVGTLRHFFFHLISSRGKFYKEAMANRKITKRDCYFYFKHIFCCSKRRKDKIPVKYVTGSVSFYKHCKIHIRTVWHF